MSSTRPIRLGISRCLLGDEVRFDGGHKRDGFLVDTLARYVEWVPVCPEVEVGMGIPREPIRLTGSADSPHLIAVTSGLDHTTSMERFSQRRVRELEDMDLSGYVFKKDSPSCGMERVRIYNPHDMPSRNGMGVFARAFMERFPLIPVEEEGRLNDPILRDNFIERVFSYRRWRDLMRSRITHGAVINFHTAHKYLLLAHSPAHYQTLGRLVSDAKQRTPKGLAQRYGMRFMETLKVRATVRKHANVLHHIIGHFSKKLEPNQREELREAIDDYHKGSTPLIVPLTLIKHYARLFNATYILNQVYLNPHPKELMLN